MTHLAGVPQVSGSALPPTQLVAVLRQLLTPVMWRIGLAAVVDVPGRRTGAPRHVALIPLEVAGSWYLVSMHGNTEWVRNLRAARCCELRRSSGTHAFSTTEVYGNERDRAIAGYLAKSPRPFRMDFNRRPSAEDHPVFRMAPIG